MKTITIKLEINNPTRWELSALSRLTREMVFAPGGLTYDYAGYTPEMANSLEQLISYGAISHSLPGENGNHYYLITELGQAILDQAGAMPRT